MRELHNVEKNEDVLLVLEKIIQILISDEPEKGMEDLKKVEIPDDIQQKFNEVDSKAKLN